MIAGKLSWSEKPYLWLGKPQSCPEMSVVYPFKEAPIIPGKATFMVGEANVMAGEATFQINQC